MRDLLQDLCALFLGVYAFAQSMLNRPARKTGRKPNGGKHG